MELDCDSTAGTTCETIIISTELVTSPLLTTIETTFTTTKQITTTCQVTPGGTVTISPPATPWFIDPSATTAVISAATVPSTTTYAQPSSVTLTESTTSTTSVTAATKTVIEIIIYLQDPDSHVYSTSTVTLPVATATESTYIQPTPFTVVVGREGGDGWDTWSNAQKGGLIAGCLVALLTTLFLLLCLCKRLRARHIWIANDWSVNSHPVWSNNQCAHGRYGAGTLTMRGGADVDQLRAEQVRGNEHIELPPTYQDSVSCKHGPSKNSLRRLCGDRARFYQPPTQPQ